MIRGRARGAVLAEHVDDVAAEPPVDERRAHDRRHHGPRQVAEQGHGLGLAQERGGGDVEGADVVQEPRAEPLLLEGERAARERQRDVQEAAV